MKSAGPFSGCRSACHSGSSREGGSPPGGGHWGPHPVILRVIQPPPTRAPPNPGGRKIQIQDATIGWCSASPSSPCMAMKLPEDCWTSTVVALQQFRKSFLRIMQATPPNMPWPGMCQRHRGGERISLLLSPKRQNGRKKS